MNHILTQMGIEKRFLSARDLAPITANLDNLLKERQIIRETRGKAEQQTGQKQAPLPSLLFAGVILEGGIIGYDSNTVTGGIGARYLGIGGDAQYRQDTVTVYLNAISSQSGEILKSVMTRKTVASYGVRGSVFKFVAFQKLLEGETGYTVNEPGQIAVAQAIEHAVRALIIEGSLEGLWQFEDEVAGKEETQAYLADKDDDFLLGDATSQVAQALLTDEQLEQLAEARAARRERLKAQAERRQQRELAAQQAETKKQKQLAAQTQAPKALSPAPRQQAAAVQRQTGAAPVPRNTPAGNVQVVKPTKVALSPEQLAALVQKEQQAALRQVATKKAGPETQMTVPNAGAGRPTPRQQAGLQAPKMDALNAVFSDFAAETQEQRQSNPLSPATEQPEKARLNEAPVLKPAASLVTPISAASLKEAADAKDGLTWPSGEKL